eukprot:2266183-Karenia_brevis.AAC.1
MARRKIRTLRGPRGRNSTWQGLQQFPKNTLPTTTGAAAPCWGNAHEHDESIPRRCRGHKRYGET